MYVKSRLKESQFRVCEHTHTHAEMRLCPQRLHLEPVHALVLFAMFRSSDGKAATWMSGSRAAADNTAKGSTCQPGPACNQVCWPDSGSNFALPSGNDTKEQRCALRYATLREAKTACELLREDWCGAIVRDGGLKCGNGRAPPNTQYELRTGKSIDFTGRLSSWLLSTHPSVPRHTHCNVLPALSETDRIRGRQTTIPSAPPCCAIDGLDELVSTPFPMAASHEHEERMQQRAIACKRNRKDLAGGLTRCMRKLDDEEETHRLHFAPKAACAHLDHCNGRGDCFLGACFCFGHFHGKRCEQAAPVRPRCSMRSDSCFRSPMHGRPHVTMERWQRASWAEESWWDSAADRKGDTSDHGGAMLAAFDNFRKVGDDLGDVIEIGCGPFTQVCQREDRWQELEARSSEEGSVGLSCCRRCCCTAVALLLLPPLPLSLPPLPPPPPL